ncbi:hypothetical protein K469DRAFT_648665 [Zopfia rhizophila CBS 207.26]|uniref:Uncharacterized protein n=1 Tax=Zopfia rhizophila CBS 207.26 TaxID=1314779 RepID=A0A6A6ESG3_9PEZI|nr:hypothetical protein K469DRAFT_648665 [Zopfia rhizophila CBS 207.26]
MKFNPIFPRAGGGGGSSKPYMAPPSVGHEIGVMFGGIATMLLGAIVFYIWWRLKLARDIKLEEDRIRGLKRKGLFDEERRASAVEERQKRESVVEI